MKKISFIGSSYGKSMVPLVNPKDRLFIKKVKKKDVLPGDIVAFYNGKKCIIHRVLAKKKNTIIVKGDNVPFADKVIEFSEILGKIAKIDGKYGVIDFEEKSVRLFQRYFFLRSIILLHTPPFLYRPLSAILRGRRLITKYMAKDKKKVLPYNL